ncbi:helix-turn-helix transcriptional regulator [Staphylococcus epidermidis]|uniref:helix-turn-helix domain-containing protein n=1 Tax=Staphylococcus epidermidis TaxID=1282 RepID=UPI0018B039DF|nr:helix-turn-helix transcriptional regulator [Staphylococcus epidermidis]MBF9307624.1 helix-turn-helix transcriptional regulator [Staphylococcus epidermidis]
MISKLIDEDIQCHPELKNSYKEQSEALDFAIDMFYLRQYLGWSQEQMAEIMNVSPSAIVKIENGDIF